MLTQCPQCRTVFRLSLSLLEAAEGRVRCGQCGAIFDASGDLPDDLQKLLSQHSSTAEAGPDVLFDSPQDDEAVPEFSLSEEELDEVFVEAAPSFVAAEFEAADESFDSTADTAENEILDLEVAAARAQEDITLEGGKISIFNEETGEYRTFAAENAEEVTTDATRDEAAAPASSLQPDDATLTEEPTAHSNTLPPADFADFAAIADAAARRRTEAAQAQRHRSRVLWTTGAVLLALLLAVQLVHFNRQSLARNASLGPMLAALYAHLGMRLDPVWDLSAYGLRQWGAAADANGTLRVRASVFNKAQRPQPYPLLRLTLQNRFGERVGLRDVQPREYLPAASANGSGRFLDPGQRIDADIAIVDPGKNAIGFELDVCLRDEHNFVRCANDVRQNAG